MATCDPIRTPGISENVHQGSRNGCLFPETECFTAALTVLFLFADNGTYQCQKITNNGIVCIRRTRFLRSQVFQTHNLKQKKNSSTGCNISFCNFSLFVQIRASTQVRVSMFNTIIMKSVNIALKSIQDGPPKAQTLEFFKNLSMQAYVGFSVLRRKKRISNVQGFQ